MDRMATAEKRIKVVFFQRKPRQVGNYSVEIYYDEVRKRLPAEFEPVKVIVPYESKGLFKRIYNAVYCAFKQGDINHVTGDIHYVTLFLRKRKTILTVLDCRMLQVGSGLKRWVLKTFWFTLPAKKANYITVISQATKEDLLQHIAFPPEKVIVIYVSVSSSFERTPRAFNKTKPVILQVGTAENKNVIRVAGALKGIGCKFIIIGNYHEELAAALRENEIDHEYISERVPQEKMLEHYYNADIISFVSTFEGFGMPIIEGNIVGRAVITSNISSMPEVAGNAAHLVDDPYDIGSIRNGFLKIINDDEYRERLIENGYTNAARFSKEQITIEHSALYREIAGNTRKDATVISINKSPIIGTNHSGK